MPFINFFRKFKAKLWKCYHMTNNSPHFTFFAKPAQCWCNFVISTLRKCCKFDVTVATLYRHLPLQHP